MPKLSSHPIVDLLENNTISPSKKFREGFLKNIQNGDFESSVRLSLNKEEDYHWNVSIEINKLVASFRRIQIIIDFLSIPLEDIPSTDEKLSGLIWLTYHYSSFIWTIVSVVDITLILTSVIFNLGIPPKHCRIGLILDHEFVSEKVKKALKNLNTEVNRYRESRNLILHRGDSPDMEGASKLAVLEALTDMKPDVFQSETESHYQNVCESLSTDINKKGEVLENLVSELFDALKPSYEKEYGNIRGDLLQKALSK